MANPTQRFSTRVENYVRYRPRYPKEIVALLTKDCGLQTDSVIADVGSGTGFLAELFLTNGNRVFGIEPNGPMREAGERFLASYSSFTSLDATAEATTLPDQSIDFVTAGQAFHWFNRDQCRMEFRRILRAGGWVVLIWNDRHTESTPFLRAYEELLHRFATDYAQVDHKQVDAAVLREFFGREPMKKILPNFQAFDLTSLKGRLLSSSYVPDKGQPRYEQMVQALEQLFDEHKKEGKVTFEYDTLIHCGQLSEK